MELYIKRAVQGRLRQAADDVGIQLGATSNVTTITNEWAKTAEQVKNQVTRSELLANDYSNKLVIINSGGWDSEGGVVSSVDCLSFTAHCSAVTKPCCSPYTCQGAHTGNDHCL
jgi:hypothetical protein